MKKTLFFLMSLCALTISSCMKEENPEISGETYTYTFNGTAGPETKVSVGDKTEEGWPIKWTGGGNTDNAKNSNATLWSNSSYNTKGRSYGIAYSTKWGNLYHYRAAAYAVRCMKDTENR